MTRRRAQVLRVLIPLLLFLLGCNTGAPQPPTIGYDESNLVVLGEAARLAPGSAASFLVQVRNPYGAGAKAVADAPVTVRLQDADNVDLTVFTGDTDGNGLVNVRFAVPEELSAGDYQLIVEAQANGRHRVLQQPVQVGRAYNVLLSTDKPVYQPGQTIHIRGLALDALNLHAADGETVTFTVSDPQGNKLARSAIAASAYGVASMDFVLDTQAPSGDYMLTAALGATESTRSVEVKPYSLPRFAITFASDKPYYLPGDTATGSVAAHYFFGKPVAGGAVAIRGTVTVDDVTSQVLEITGVTDEAGVFAYEFPVPDFFTGRLNNRKATVDLNIAVVDTAGHREEEDEEVTVAERIMLIDAVPESGKLRPGLENLIYIDVSYPDGAAAQVDLVVTGRNMLPISTTTDIYGLGVVSLTAPSRNLLGLEVVATDAAGNIVKQPLTLGGEVNEAGAVLLRPEKTAYQVGDTINLDILTIGAIDTVYLDVIKDRQTFALQELPVIDGLAQAAIPVDGSLLGTLEINAYAALPDALLSDRRLVLVEPAAAAIDVTADAEVYRPGDTAHLDLQVTRDGAPMPGVIGVAIVDESVFSIEEQEPGFARSFFLIDRELKEPRYGLHEYVDLGDSKSPYDDAPSSIQFAQRGRQVALAGWFAHALSTAADADKAQAVAADSAPVAQIPWGNRLYLLAPLVGIALYNGSRRRRQLLIALVIFSLGAFFWTACSSGGVPGAAPAAAPAAESAATEIPAAFGSGAGTTASQPPRLRQYFPETLYWLPELETDADGRAQIDVPIADSITTWRVSLLASDVDGNLGSADVGLRVFQDFFVEPDLPRYLTVGDEIDVPVSIFNYLDQPQKVELTFSAGTWFEFLGDGQLTVDIGPNEVAGITVPIRVTDFGDHEFTVTALGTNMSDAVARPVAVLPDGKPLAAVENGYLEAEQQFTVALPADSVPGTGQLTLRIYPSMAAEIVQGLDAMLAEPYGCFEQTSSATYPNVLILDYLRQIGKTNPDVEARARRLIEMGYQRLLGFEVQQEPGGFSLYGDPPAVPAITAYGLQEFVDMSNVAFVDPALIGRMVSYLESRQSGDGSWLLDRYDSGDSLERRIVSTAYVVWGMADSGYQQLGSVQRAIDYIDGATTAAATQSGSSEALPASRGVKGNATPTPVGGYPSPRSAPAAAYPRTDGLSTYALAVIANAYVAAGRDATPILAQLLERSRFDADHGRYWEAETQTYYGGYGAASAVETTALVAQALLRTEYDPVATNEAIAYLVAQRDPYGGFGATQATVQVLKALILANAAEQEDGAATVQVLLQRADGTTESHTLAVDDATEDLTQQLVFAGVEDGASVTITVDGERKLPFQLVTDYYQPWTSIAAAEDAPLHIDVRYDRTELAVNETVEVNATVDVQQAQRTDTLMVAVGIPPGFAPVTSRLDELVSRDRIDRYELIGNRIVFYLSGLTAGDRVVLPYELLARYVVRARTPGGEAYNYYAPDKTATAEPQRIVVTLATP